jgi:beta-lactamase class A
MLVHAVHRKKNKSFRNLFLIIIIVCLVTGLSLFNKLSKTSNIISPISIESKSQIPFISKLFMRQRDPKDLEDKIKSLVGNKWVNYSVFVVDYLSDFRMGIGENVIYTAASINKLPIISALYYGNQMGEINMDKVITLQAEDIQDYGTGTIRYDPPGTSYTVKTLARLMMEKSDNTAAYILANYVIGLPKIQSLMESWGLIQTDMAGNKTSNRDIELLFNKIYHGKITNPANTDELFSFLKNSDFEDRIPALLPKNVTVYHKIGNGPGMFHDAGIVSGPKISYYIGIFTSDVTDEIEATKTAALVSKTVYDYLK